MTLWSERLVTDLFDPVPQRMFTLTVPKRIRPFFLWDRKLLGLLARCAAETIRLFYRHALQEPRGTPGIVTSIQTFGNQAANNHPHIHCLVADGLILSDGSFHSSSLLAALDMAELFRREVLKAFVDQELIPEEVARNMLSWPHSGFNVGTESRILSHEYSRFDMRSNLRWCLSRRKEDRSMKKSRFSASTLPIKLQAH